MTSAEQSSAVTHSGLCCPCSHHRMPRVPREALGEFGSPWREQLAAKGLCRARVKLDGSTSPRRPRRRSTRGLAPRAGFTRDRMVYIPPTSPLADCAEARPSRRSSPAGGPLAAPAAISTIAFAAVPPLTGGGLARLSGATGRDSCPCRRGDLRRATDGYAAGPPRPGSATPRPTPTSGKRRRPRVPRLAVRGRGDKGTPMRPALPWGGPLSSGPGEMLAALGCSHYRLRAGPSRESDGDRGRARTLVAALEHP